MNIQHPTSNIQHRSDRLTVISAHVVEGLKRIAAKSVQCVVTSPPYWGLRSYLPKGHPLKHLEIGQEKTPDCGRWNQSKVQSPKSKVDLTSTTSPQPSPPFHGGEGEESRGCGECYVCTLLAVFGGRDNPVGIWRVLRDDGTVWLNLGDSYAGGGNGGGGSFALPAIHGADKNEAARTGNRGVTVKSKRIVRGSGRWGGGDMPAPGLKAKDLIGMPWRVALALQAAGWYLRSDIVWAKRNCMPESVTDRPTRSHEYIFLRTKSARYFYDAEAIKEPCIYDVDGTGTTARRARERESLKSYPTAERNGLRLPPNEEGRRQNEETNLVAPPLSGSLPHFMAEREENGAAAQQRPTANGGYKNSANFEGKNKGNDKQRGHSRRHDGFNSRWDAMEKEEQCAGMRNKRDVWTVSPANYPEAHFATFPPELITPCILAGTSAGDACAQCGVPLKRMIEVGSQNLAHQRACGGDAAGEYTGQSTKGHDGQGVQDASAVKARVLASLRERKTVGWEPTCTCGDKNSTGGNGENGEGQKQGNVDLPDSVLSVASCKTVPCVVLDPFGGSGTTGEVALELGRRAILIELNPEYLPLIEQRTQAVTPGLLL